MKAYECQRDIGPVIWRQYVDTDRDPFATQRRRWGKRSTRQAALRLDRRMQRVDALKEAV